MNVFSRIGRKVAPLSSKLHSCPNWNFGVDQHLQRNLSTGLRLLAPSVNELRPKAITKDDKREFMAIFPDIVRELTLERKYDLQSELGNFLAKIMQYNVSGGKNTRGLTTVYSYRMLAPEKDLTPENIRRSQVLGWCIEMVQGFLIMLDDLTDGAEIRRQRPCWYTLPDVKIRAATDALILQSEVFNLLQKYCKDKPYYVPLTELFLESIRQTAYGQLMDYVTSFHKVDTLTMDRYNFIVKHKTSHYTFVLPVAVGMYLAGIYDRELHRQARSVLYEIGKYFQVQDDYIDVYGNEEITGKRGSDIREGKCTWLAIIAFQRASPAQRAVLMECYGKKDDEKVNAVKEVFLQLGLPSLYNAYEEETYNLINRQIQQLSAGLPHELFLTVLHKIYGRKK